MNIIVDTNIVFSAIINANGTIGDLLLNSPDDFRFYSPESSYRIFSAIELISEEIIKKDNWLEAFNIVKDIDEKDTTFVALAMEMQGILWTGDKILIKGLKSKGYQDIYSTNDLLKLRGY